MRMRSARFLLLSFSALGGFVPLTLSAQTPARTPDRTAPAARDQGDRAPARKIVRQATATPRVLPGINAAEARPETVQVTGSFLGTSNNANANPVQIITARQIQQTSATTLGDYLQRLPSIGSAGTSNAEPAAGAACTDLRNLGGNRVLVLIDGKRTAINGNNDCVDLNTIPVQQIASVEILKDGGSELYGADAVSGVVNIKLRHDLGDGGLTARGGITPYGDRRTGVISGYKGFNFDHGRGNVTVFGQYDTQGMVYEPTRAWAADPQVTNAPAGIARFGSSILPETRVTGGGLSLVSNNDGTFHKRTAADTYNFAQDKSLLGYLQNSSLSGDAHYDVSPHLTLYSNVRYSHRTASILNAAEPVEGSIAPSTLPESLILPAGSPYNSFGRDVYLTRRMNEFGPRADNNASDTYTVMGGAKGEIVAGWQYDASMTYGWNQDTDSIQNIGNYLHITQELGIRQLDPSSASSKVVYDPTVCTGQPGCVLQNPFMPWSQQAANYAKFTENNHSSYQLRDFNLRLHNDHVAHMPYRDGGTLGIALGMEHRSEQLSYSPDPILASGDSADSGSAYTGGGFNVTEVYGEAKLQLLHNAFLARDLTVDAQGRWSDYNTFGSTRNWKSSINWAPVSDIRFRATLGTSYRQPNVYELYGGQSFGYVAGNDPCSQVSSYGASAAAVQARCLSEGVDPKTFVSTNGGYVPTISGGNTHLRPETGKTYTVGAVVTPHWVPGLSASVEYWHYTIKNTISSIGSQYILDQCYTGAGSAYCGSIAPRSASGQLTSVYALDENLGGLRTSGIDFDLDYRLRLSWRDTLSLSNNFQQLVSYLEQYVPGGAWYNYAGRLFYQGGIGMNAGGQPRVRDYATVTWRHDAFSLTYMMTYTGGMVWNNGTRDLTRATAGQYQTPGIFMHDITLGYRLKRWNFEAGISNLLDKKPPFVFDSISNTNRAVYGALEVGRYMFLQAGVNF
ncbi:TonB-dependent receptor protein [Gluconacetobacter sacchari DSM 12717]|nr:TonB-dependent receptor [Gluconacetobacter sacchari]GBQ26965.1 TonB-dependent receptor protein [Gluconacetobacter sacchari DSM 12717]